MTKRFLIEKHSHPAELLLTDGRTLRVLLYLADFAQTHGGHQTVRDLVDEPGAVLPAVDNDGEFVLIHKSAVSGIAVVPTELDLEGFWHERPATIRIAGGHRIDGSLLVEEGSGERLSDVINHTVDWLRMRLPNRLVWVRMAALITARSPEA